MDGKDAETGQFAKGNRFWEASPHTGRKPHYDDPAQMFDDAIEYFGWVEDNPLMEEKAFGTGLKVKVEKMRPATQGGLQTFLGMSRQSWDDYRRKDLFSAVIMQIEEMIREQKFAGAAAGLLNPNIIARDLGLIDKTLLGNDPDNPLPPVTLYQLPDNGRD